MQKNSFTFLDWRAEKEKKEKTFFIIKETLTAILFVAMLVLFCFFIKAM